MTTIQLTDADLDPHADALAGTFLDDRHFDRVITDTTTVLKPDGSLLLIYRRKELPQRYCELAFDAFKNRELKSANRTTGGPRIRPIKADGTRSRTSQAKTPAPTGIVGFYDRTPRMPFCRQTAFTADHPEVLDQIWPFIAAVDRTFRDFAPDRWEAQRVFLDAVQGFVIPETVFSTLTVNKNFRTRAHKDKGDYQPGLGVMAALEGGLYSGAELIFPKFRTAVDMRTGGILLADVHELHGNSPFIGRPGSFKRLSFVFYARGKMNACGTPEQELQHARSVGR